MFPAIQQYCEERLAEFSQIPEERKALLHQLAAWVGQTLATGKPARLNYICTHNSRRSHFGQVWAQVAAEFYGIHSVETFSGGTEATAFNPNAIAALKRAGMNIVADDPSASNPHYTVDFGGARPAYCYSKKYNDPGNPTELFAAVMTCGDADENCPFIPGASLRIATTYSDPKAFDQTPQQDEKYAERSQQIARECLYVFAQVSAIR